ncbi:MAG: ECF-type sigma factor [Acidobacteriota bacterium]
MNAHPLDFRIVRHGLALLTPLSDCYTPATVQKPSTEITALLREWSNGDPEALRKLMPMVFEDVKAMARKALALEVPWHTLQPTALVNEAYMRLIDRKTYWWKDRAQFFSSLAKLMRRILVDHARKRLAAKRGGGEAPLPLDESISASIEPHPDLILLDDALDELEQIDPRRYQIVMLWFFVGLTQQEIAKELGMSINTVGRQWQAARRWLKHQMRRADIAETDVDLKKGDGADDERA